MENQIHPDDCQHEGESNPMFDNDDSQTQEQEPFDISQLPLDLQCCILEKFDYKQFVCFEKTSQLAHTICSSKQFSVPCDLFYIYVNKRKTNCSNDYDNGIVPRIPWHVASRSSAQIRAHIISIKNGVTSGRIQAVTNTFIKNRTTAKNLVFNGTITWPVDMLERLIMVTKPEYITFYEFLHRKYFVCPSLQKANSLIVGRTGCTDEDLIKLKFGTLNLKSNFITTKGVNVLIKQWKRREREINNIFIEFGFALDRRSVEDIFRGIEANLIWSSDSHEDSVLHAIPHAELDAFLPGDYLYSMWIPDDPEKTFFIYLCNNSFCAYIGSGEMDLVLRGLSDDQYYIVRNECVYCSTQFCEHRRKYSTARLKTHFPKTYKAVMFGVQVMGVVSASASVFNFITGEHPYCQTSSLDHNAIREETGRSKILAFLRVHLFDYV